MSRFRVGFAELNFPKILASCAVLALIGTAPALAAESPPAPAASEEKPVAAPNTAPKVTLPYKLITAPAQSEQAPAKPVEAQPANAKASVEPAVTQPAAPSDAKQQTASQPDAAAVPKSETAAAPAKPEPPKITLNIDIDLTKQRMTLTEYGKVAGTWPISSGAEGHRSPTGTFRPIWSSKMWYSKQYDNAPMPHSVFFNGGVAMHATQSVGRLGTPASHGCIRQSPANAEKTYKLVAKHGNSHVKIVVHGKPKDYEPRIARRDRGNDRDMAAARFAPRDRYDRYERQATRRVIIVDGYGNRRVAEISANDPRLAAYNSRRYGGYGNYGYGSAW